eukprot:TRINITY_DN3488_c0_g1_i1.p1 TRINITY_DN3488_c0_g1~~TRINITY_DN3488_c0_g1_i1.p1  ORF type:complete len:780 (+),score=281.68 TRINITY_DN3488_c0_g1_i1:97-2436(+)
MSTRNKKEQKWQQVQERAFTSWMAQTLQKKDKSMTVTDLRVDLEDGTKLIKFFEQLSKRTMKERYYPQPKSRIQKIQNCHLALQFLERETGVSAYHSGCSAEDIVDAQKELKLILGLLWTLYRKFRMVVTVLPSEAASASSTFDDWDPSDTASPYYNSSFDPASKQYDALAWFNACLATSDPKCPTYDPSAITYDPTLDGSNAAYIPALDPMNHQEYKTLLDPVSDKYNPALDPAHPAYNPKMDPTSPQYDPRFDSNSDKFDGSNADVAAAIAAAKSAADAHAALRAAGFRRNGKEAGLHGVAATTICRSGRRAGKAGAFTPGSSSSSGKSVTKGPEDQMLEWVRRLVGKYDGVNITNYRNSFSDGLAFAALVKEYDPTTLPEWAELRKMPAEKVLELAMNAAEKHMGVTRLLDVDEIVEGSVDDRAMALYSSLYYTAFQNKTQMDAMQSKMSSDLQLEKKSAEELIKLHQDISSELAATKVREAEEKEHEERLHQELLELRAKVAELTDQLAARDKDLAQARLDFTNVERDRNELMSNNHQLQERNHQLNEQVEAIQLLCDSETAKAKKASRQLKAANAENKATKDQVQQLTDLLETQTKTSEGNNSKLIEELQTEKNKNEKLSEEKSTLEQQKEQLFTQLEETKTTLNSEAKSRKKTASQLVKHQDQLKLNTEGLAILRKNLNQHLDDLNRWHKYLEGSAADVEEVQDSIGQLTEELEKLGFKEQLNLLSGRLETENVSMTKILQEKLAKQQQQLEQQRQKEKEKENREKESKGKAK